MLGRGIMKPIKSQTNTGDKPLIKVSKKTMNKLSIFTTHGDQSLLLALVLSSTIAIKLYSVLTRQ